MNDGDILFTPQQYDLLTVDKPERQRKPRPEAKIAEDLRVVFTADGDRTLYQVARKLYDEIGVELTRLGLDALAELPGWSSSIVRYGVSSMTQITRIVQAAAAQDDNDREIVDIRLELGKRQRDLEDADHEVTAFLQELHTAHPAMRKQIKAAAEMVVKAAFKHNVEQAPTIIKEAVRRARLDKDRIRKITLTYRVPRETAQWLIQILVRL